MDNTRRGRRWIADLAWVFLVSMACLLESGCTSMSASSTVVTSDPVCGAVVNRAKALRKVYGGRDYYFDSQQCAAEFEAHPSTYAAVHTSRVGPR